MKGKIAMMLMAGALAAVTAAESTIKLPEPDKEGGMPLMQALANRKTGRQYKKDVPVTNEILSSLLWAANGFNRPDKRTAPTAINLQELELYVLKADGCWFYDAQNNALVQKGDKDLRAATVANIGFQPFVVEAPVTIVIVSDVKKATSRGRKDFSEIDSGYISQNIYLYCASAGLATCVRASFPPTLAKAMGLSDDQRVILCQTVGYPQ